MVRTAVFLLGAFSLLSSSAATAGGDKVILENGTQYAGDILFWTSSEFVISLDEKAEPEHIPAGSIRTIHFGTK